MARRVVEWIKSILIVLLLGSAVLLAVMAVNNGMLPDLSSAGLLEKTAGITAQSQTVRSQTAAKPVQISIRSENGRASALCDAAVLDSVYERFGGSFGQALETDEAAVPCDMAAVQQALSVPSIYFSYPGDVPLSALAQWLDAEHAGVEIASWLALSIDGDTVWLYYGTDEQASVCRTYLQADRLLTELTSFRPDGSVFAFESEVLSALAPLTLLNPDNAADIYAVQAANAYSEDTATHAASLLGFNPYGDGYYTEADGTVVFSEVGCTLRIGTDGTISVVNQNSDNAQLRAADESLTAAIEAARALVSELTRPYLGSAVLYLSELIQADGVVTVCFDYYLNGIRIFRQEDHAAQITISGTQITQASVRVRTYTLLTETCTLLPAMQAQALSGEGGRLRIAYADTGAANLSAGWIS